MVTPDFDEDYEQEDFFGEPYKELVDFFREYPRKGEVLDVGCGQGRDSITLAKLGYKVTGVDSSKVGIFQMLEKAEKLKLEVAGVVDNIFTFVPSQKYDIVLLDSVLIFHKRSKEKETTFLLRILDYVRTGGLFCIFIHKWRPTEKYLKSILERAEGKWGIIVDRYLDFDWKDKGTGERLKLKYNMVCFKKIR